MMEIIVLLAAEVFSKELLAEIKLAIKEYIGARMITDFKPGYPNMIIGDTMGEEDFKAISNIIESKASGNGTLLVITANSNDVFSRNITYLK